VLCLFEAADDEVVRQVARAGLPFEQLSTVVDETDDLAAANTHPNREEGS
jgi:hypothetical protein